MNRIKTKRPAALLLAVLLVLLSGCGQQSGPALDSVEVEMVRETVTASETQQFTAELEYPQISAAAGDTGAEQLLEKLNTQFQQDAEAFVQQAQKVVQTAALPAGQSSYQAEVRYNEDGMLSVVQCESFADGSYLQYAATYSLDSGEKMSMGELLGMKEAKAQETAAKMFCGVAEADPDTFRADAADYINANIDQVQYYRYAEGLGVFFQAGEIAPVSAGILEMVMQ